MSITINDLTVTKAQQHLVNKDFSAHELAEAYLKVIEEKNESLRAYIEVFDDVLLQADAADETLAREGERAPALTGIPIAVKDNILIEGRRASACSRMLEEYVAPYDATVTQKLRAAGTIFLGRTNMDEFAMGSSTERSCYGPTRNPLDPTRVPGGSSGGSAAAVAMGGCLAALGSDTGGSIRQPASFCGVVGLKPTYGAVSRSGLIAMGSSLDQIGSITKTARDAELFFAVSRARDPLDSTTLLDDVAPDRASVAPRVIGVPRHFMEFGLDPAVARAFEDALERFRELGYEVRDIELPHVRYALACYYIIMPAEASTNLARYDGVRYGLHVDGENLLDDYMRSRSAGFGEEVRRRIILGAYVLSAGYYDAYYNRAVALRRMIRDECARVFESGVSVIATPTTPTPAFRLGAKTSDPVAMYLADLFTVPANIAGLPALSIPMGDVPYEGATLPVGLQLMAGHGQESTLFDAGKAFLGE
ncbi:MAG: Asp-tRNA(Asn)/Glu-tRNA(Gln) amidotransferase subunit GatA [bacterium]|nr:Asp-tRNA(Asn)/Glu-tRNA(Gln) amidotransferase subunit GatA [bacterium]MDZ4285247.1 Asp-tRNA(Asn)/Glu-tRNA(Gln) amidotransferase subunit GatA [Patescibacteria group bacterium]